MGTKKVHHLVDTFINAVRQETNKQFTNLKQNNNLTLDVDDIGTLFYCNTINELQLENGEVELYFPQNSFYKDFYFKFYRNSSTRNTISPTFTIHDASVPVHKYYVIASCTPRARLFLSCFAMKRWSIVFFISTHKFPSITERENFRWTPRPARKRI